MGAWIETKLIIPEETVIGVAPYMGAWIETIELLENPETPRVAPYMGAWIETCVSSMNFFTVRSHPTWVRGLKRTKHSVCADWYCRTLHGCVD